MITRADEAARWRKHLAQCPHDALGWHNLAAAEGDLGRAAAAEVAARRAMALGITASETRLVLARALQSLGRLDEAASAFDEALRRKPNYADAHRDYAQLIWMRTGRKELALERLDAALRATPRDPSLHLICSVVHESADDHHAAIIAANVGLDRAPSDIGLLLQSAHLASEFGDAARALSLSSRAASVGAGPRAQIARCEALLALGRVDEMMPVVTLLRQSLHENQYIIALQATAWRLQGDARYGELHDYARLVATQTIGVPPGWSSLTAFLADAVAELGALHRFVAHPLQQSVRGGGQLTLQEDHMRRPIIAALFTVLNHAVQNYLAALGRGEDPMRSRNSGRGAFTGAWSVRLASGGSHVDHIHPQGWLSSACYLALPGTIGAGTATHPPQTTDRAGWLRLGRPGIRTAPPLEADYFVKPEPGMLALFPAYIWHGVEPFTGDQRRLTVAFDVVPG